MTHRLNAAAEADRIVVLDEGRVVERGITKRYGPVEALRGIDLTIQPGELVALLGPNGAGKTTAVRILLGLAAPTSGQASVFGRHPRPLRPRTRSSRRSFAFRQ